MDSDRQLEFSFVGGREGTGPATWGQAAIWAVVRDLGSDAARYNVSGGVPLPEPVPMARLETAVLALVLRHESLRTVLRTSDDGRLEQVVLAAGAVPVLVRRSEPEAVRQTAFALRDEMLAVPFDAERDWPVRVGAIQTAAGIGYVVFNLSHTATDGWGLRNLLADCGVLLGGAVPEAELLQPLDEAAFQRSERGRRRDAAARRSWLDKLGRGPVSLFPARAGQPPAATFPNAVLCSPALSLAMDRVAAGLAVSPSAVLLAAAASAVTRLTGVPEAVFQVVVNNRFLPGMGGGVNTIAQEGLFQLAETDGDFTGVVRRTFGATLSAQRHAYYDKLALERDIAGVARPADHSCFVNDQRGLLPASLIPRAKPEPLLDARGRTTLTWPVEHEPRKHVSFALDAQDAPGAVELAMTADSALMPRADMAEFLFGIEDLVINEALSLN